MRQTHSSKRNNWAMLSTAIAIAYLFTACSGVSTQQKTASNDAITALRKLEAASQVKTSSYREYSQLLIEAKAKVNQAAAVLPEGALKNELNATTEAYTDAATAWAAMQGNEYLSDRREPGKTLGPKYDINLDGPRMSTLEYMDSLERLHNPNYESPAVRGALGKMWAVAKTHLDRASALINQ